MPLNATSYLEEHGWEGKGVALDGKQGRGLKKPLALPMKRNLKGLGKDRDRATEWWDCLFETSAKSINIQVDQKQDCPTKKAVDAAAALSKLKGKDNATSIEKVVAIKTNKGSLVSQAKREYARKMLMSGFVRAGKETLAANNAERDLDRILAEQEAKKQAEIQVTSIPKKGVDTPSIIPTKEKRRRVKQEKKARKEEKRLKKVAKEDKASKKRKRNEDIVEAKEKEKGGNEKPEKKRKKAKPH